MGVNEDVIEMAQHEADVVKFVHLLTGGGAMELWHTGLRHLSVMSLYAPQTMVRDVHLGFLLPPLY